MIPDSMLLMIAQPVDEYKYIKNDDNCCVLILLVH